MSSWCFLVPYRNREEHLRVFVKHYRKLFPEVPIIVIEQEQKTPFNRGKLLNIGFTEVGCNFDYVCIHDVDLILEPEKGEGADGYRRPENPTLLATHLGQFNQNLAYKEFFGGINLFTSEHFKAFNGFSNTYYSWGGEDSELYDHILRSGFTIDRRELWHKSLNHKRNFDPVLLKENIKRCREPREEYDGLSHCEYDLLSYEDKGEYILIKVDLLCPSEIRAKQTVFI